MEEQRNRCIRSKISEYHLDLWTWLISVQMCTPTGSRWASNKNITRCHRQLESVWVRVPVGVSGGTRCQCVNQLADWGLAALSDPRLSSPARMRKKCCYGQKNFGSICSSLSPSPTHLLNTSNINPFASLLRIKCERYIFYKEVCSFVHWSLSLLLTMFPHIFVYVYLKLYMYVALQYT